MDIRVSIDRGGTFCDVIATGADGGDPVVFKLLSEDPANYRDAPTEAIRRILEKFEGKKIPLGEKLDASRIGLSVFLEISMSVGLRPCSIMPHRHDGGDECTPDGKWGEVCLCHNTR